MKQLAVEWLLDNLISEPYSEEDFKYNKECWDKAREMEKQQIIDAWNKKCKIDGVLTFTDNRTDEEYYNETFKQQ